MTDSPLSAPTSNPRGPVFISYRHEGGAATAQLIDTYLRSGGIVPWRDAHDLDAGETDARIHEALHDGVASAILVVTEGIEKSTFIPEHELPPLLRMDAESPASSREHLWLSPNKAGFRLYVANTFEDPEKPTQIDTGKPDVLLLPDDVRSRHGLTGHLLANRKQYALTERHSDLPRMLRDLLRQRLAARRRDLSDGEIKIALQTRPEPYAHLMGYLDNPDAPRFDLTIRLRQDTRTGIPQEIGYRCLQKALPILADEVSTALTRQRTASTTISFFGGGHPSLFWALGSAFPEARHGDHNIEVHDNRPFTAEAERCSCRHKDADEPVWGVHSSDCDKQTHLVRGNRDLPAKDGLTKPPLMVFLQGTAPHDHRPVEALATSLPGCSETLTLRVDLRVEPSDPGERPRDYDPAQAVRLAKEFASYLRTHARHYTIHLASSLPAPQLLLIARYCNTVPVVFYELEQDVVSGVSSYRAVIRTLPGSPLAPITDVYPHSRMPFSDDEPITTLINMTPHDVTLFDGDREVRTWPAEGSWTRRNDTSIESEPLSVDGITIPLRVLHPGPLSDVPPRRPGVAYIVSRISAEAARRGDFVFPEGEVRNAAGQQIGCRAFASFDHAETAGELKVLTHNLALLNPPHGDNCACPVDPIQREAIAELQARQ